MIRATILSLVLALATGPVSACCGGWFAVAAAAASDCHDPGGSGRHAGRDVECQPTRLGVVAVLNEAGRRGIAADGMAAIPFAALQLVAAGSRRRIASASPRAVCGTRRPLAAPLRI